MNRVYDITPEDLAIARRFAEQRDKHSRGHYKKRGNTPSRVMANCMNGMLAEMKAKLFLDEHFSQHVTSELALEYTKKFSWDPDFTIHLRDAQGNPAGKVFVHVKSFVLGKYPEFPDADGNDRWVTPPSFMFQKTDLGPGHGDADMKRIRQGGNSTDLLIGGVFSCNTQGRVPLDAVGDRCQLVGPFVLQQAVDQNLWKPPASRSPEMQKQKRVLHLDDLLTRVDVCTSICVD